MCHNNNGNENNYYGNPRMSRTLPELIDTLGSVKKPTGRQPIGVPFLRASPWVSELCRRGKNAVNSGCFTLHMLFMRISNED